MTRKVMNRWDSVAGLRCNHSDQIYLTFRVFFVVQIFRSTAATAAAATAAAATAAAVVLGFCDFVIGRGAAEFEGHADVLADFLDRKSTV